VKVGAHPSRLGAFLLAAGLCWCASAAGSSTPPLRPLETAIVDPGLFVGPDADAAMARAARAGATAIRVPLDWRGVAPARRPRGFDAADPEDPAYTWTGIDEELRRLREHDLRPILDVAGAPAWAFRQFGAIERPDPAAYGRFVLAAVRRYDGSDPDLPRVRQWQVGNEPNKVPGPAAKRGAAAWYRGMVNSLAASVHTRPGNVVVAGGLSPFGITTAVAPLRFMRAMLCQSKGIRPHSTCNARVHLDVWSVHPYTVGGPEHHAYERDDVSLGDLPEVRRLLAAAVRNGNVVSTSFPRLWVTEFGWDTNPPDPKGVPARVQARWVAEALYRMWSSGVSLVTWFLLRDDRMSSSPYQSGLYFRGSSVADDRPKPMLTAFRFPFVALPDDGRVLVWARTPDGKAARVVVEQRSGSGWSRLATVTANRYGIARVELRPVRGVLRARIGEAGQTSLPFAVTRTRDHEYLPFGT
jgi:hypothetical protein